MPNEFIPYFKVPTIDDLIHSGYVALLAEGERISPSKGKAIEISGITFELTNPRARLSQSFSRGKVISALGELCWYLSGSENGRVMDYYVPDYSKSNADNPNSEDCIINGAYGPRLFSEQSPQFETIYKLLSTKTHSRQAVIRIFDSKDISEIHRDVPCTCTLQFLMRDSKLNLIVYMRSNDAYKGLPHDIFCFTMFQEIMSVRLGVDLGYYKHIVGSFHLYEDDEDKIAPFLSEGWYSTISTMPQMPLLGLDDGISTLIRFENDIRETGVSEIDLSIVDKYWADLCRLLLAHKLIKDGQYEAVKALLAQILPFYSPYIVQRMPK